MADDIVPVRIPIGNGSPPPPTESQPEPPSVIIPYEPVDGFEVMPFEPTTTLPPPVGVVTERIEAGSDIIESIIEGLGTELCGCLQENAGQLQTIVARLETIIRHELRQQERLLTPIINFLDTLISSIIGEQQIRLGFLFSPTIPIPPGTGPAPLPEPGTGTTPPFLPVPPVPAELDGVVAPSVTGAPLVQPAPIPTGCPAPIINFLFSLQQQLPGTIAILPGTTAPVLQQWQQQVQSLIATFNLTLPPSPPVVAPPQPVTPPPPPVVGPPIVTPPTELEEAFQDCIEVQCPLPPIKKPDYTLEIVPPIDESQAAGAEQIKPSITIGVIPWGLHIGDEAYAWSDIGDKALKEYAADTFTVGEAKDAIGILVNPPEVGTENAFAQAPEVGTAATETFNPSMFGD